MRKYLALILGLALLVLTSQGFIFVRNFPSGEDECAGKLICQNLEGTGYDNGPEVWVEAGSGTINEDYTDTILRGEQSLYIYDTGTSYSTSPAFTATSPCYFHLMWQADAVAGSTVSFIQIRSNGTEVASVKWEADRNIQAYHGSAADYGSTVYSLDTTYHMWIDYTKSTGANDGILQVFVGTSTSKPGSPELDIDAGTSTLGATSIRLYGNSSIGRIYDQIYADDEDIGDVPD